MGTFIKGLIKNTLAILIAWVTFIVLGVVSLIILAAGFSTQSPIKVEQGSFLVIDVSRNLPDTPPVMDLPLAIRKALQDTPADVTYLYEMLETVERASRDDRIRGIFLTGSFEPQGLGSSYAAIRELRSALEAFQESGKPIMGYMTNPDQRDLYLMSVADELFMNPYGLMDLTGLGSEIVFFDGVFEKFGFDVQVARVGTYKSAVEPYTRKNLSEDNREQLETYLQGAWEEIIQTIALGRGLNPGQIQTLSNERGILNGEEMRDAGLVDQAYYLDEVIQATIAKGQEDKDNKTFVQIDVLEYIEAGGSKLNRTKGPKNSIAVVYAEGVIMPGESSEGTIGSETLSQQLREIRKNDEVKAVVFRINSPGGSAYASEVIQRELDLIQQSKPLIISQGAYAASGGYWLSAPGHHIFAEPTTLTGSIGVYVMIPHFAGAADWLGLTFDSVTTGDLTTLMTPSRPKTEGEMQVFQGYADRIYESFLARVAEGRDMTPEAVNAVAQGRIWLGSDALEIGLVDEIGGLRDAIARAIAEADVGADYKIVEYPKKKSFEEALTEGFSGGSTLLQAVRKNASGAEIEALVQPARRELEKLGWFQDPRGVYALMPYDLRL